MKNIITFFLVVMILCTLVFMIGCALRLSALYAVGMFGTFAAGLGAYIADLFEDIHK